MEGEAGRIMNRSTNDSRPLIDSRELDASPLLIPLLIRLSPEQGVRAFGGARRKALIVLLAIVVTAVAVAILLRPPVVRERPSPGVLVGRWEWPESTASSRGEGGITRPQIRLDLRANGDFKLTGYPWPDHTGAPLATMVLDACGTWEIGYNSSNISGWHVELLFPKDNSSEVSGYWPGPVIVQTENGLGLLDYIYINSQETQIILRKVDPQ